MKHPVILDACTIINLLRIDEDEFLFKSLKSLDLKIARIVYDEVNVNIKKNSLSDDQKKYIEQVIPTFLSFCRQDKDIINDLSQDFFDKLCQFVNHKKKHNGELLSSALSLCISREENCKVYFYTDDFPAKDQFTPYFSYQQIGVIGDSVDLLLFLYWAKSDFKENYLKKCLQDLKSEYNIPLKQLVGKLQSKKDLLDPKDKSTKKLIENIDKILNGYRQSIPQLFMEGISFFMEGNKYPNIKIIVKEFPDVDKDCFLAKKIQDVMNSLSSCDIFKIA